MPDFGTFTPKITLVRKFGHVDDIDDFVDAVEAYASATGVSSLEKTAEDYAELKNILTATGQPYLSLTVSAARKGENADEDVYDGFKALFAAVNNNLAEAMFEEGYTAVADSDSIKLRTSFKVKYSNGDAATLTFTDKKIMLSGYSIEATGTAFTTWANTQEIFSTDPDA